MEEEQKGFRFTKWFVDSLLCLAINDDRFLKLIRNVLAPEDLPGDTPAEILKLVYRFYDKSTKKRAPRELFSNEVEFAMDAGLVSERVKGQLDGYVEALGQIDAKSVDRDYVVGRVYEYVKRQKYIDVALDVSLKARHWDLDGAYNSLLEGLRSQAVEYDLVKDFLSEDSVRNRISRRTEQQDGFGLMGLGLDPWKLEDPLIRRDGIRAERPDLCYARMRDDRQCRDCKERKCKLLKPDYLGFFQRGYFALIMAREKQGKSWFGFHLGKQALLRSLNVFHVSHGDLTQEQMEDRYDMGLAGIGAVHEKDGWVYDASSFNLKDFSPKFVPLKKSRGTVRDGDRVSLAVKSTRAFGGRLKVKSFPRGSCSFHKFEAFVDGLEIDDEFVPDVVIVDYPDIMKLPNMEYRHALDWVYQAHSRFGQERGCVVIGFSQVKATAYRRKRITMADFAEDKRKAAHCDLAYAICQTYREEKEGIMRVICVLDRNLGVKGRMVYVVSDFRIGQFCKQAYVLDDIESGEEEKEDAGD